MVVLLGVDEAQFFPDVLEWSEEMANSGKVEIKTFFSLFSSSRESRDLLCTRFLPVFRIRIRRIHMFWASWIRIWIRNLFAQIRIRILPSTSKKMKNTYYVP
jgi:hypothetical protein